jgi:hypothetical protein
MSTPQASPLPMNRYGQMAWNHWRKWRPRMLSGIEDPQTYFSTLGQETEQEIDELAEQIAGADRPGETTLQKTARLREARISAESDLLPLRITLPAEDEEQEQGNRLGQWVEDQIDSEDPIETQRQESRQQLS